MSLSTSTPSALWPAINIRLCLDLYQSLQNFQEGRLVASESPSYCCKLHGFASLKNDRQTSGPRLQAGYSNIRKNTDFKRPQRTDLTPFKQKKDCHFRQGPQFPAPATPSMKWKTSKGNRKIPHTGDKASLDQCG